MVVCGNIQMLCYLLFTFMLAVVPQYIKWLIGSLLPWRFALALIALQYFSSSGNVMRQLQWNLFPTRPLGCSTSGGGKGTLAYQNTDLIKSATVCSNLWCSYQFVPLNRYRPLIDAIDTYVNIFKFCTRTVYTNWFSSNRFWGLLGVGMLTGTYCDVTKCLTLSLAPLLRTRHLLQYFITST